jgi:hypothetical protein
MSYIVAPRARTPVTRMAEFGYNVAVPFTRVLVDFRLRIAGFLIGLGTAGSLLGCHKTTADEAGEAGPSGDSVKHSLAGLQSQLTDLKTRFSALRTQIETVPPDLPGFQQVRAKFYAVEEGRGITDAKVMLLSGRLDTALSSGNRGELKQISKEIGETQAELGQIDQLHITLLHQVMAMQRLALRDKEAAAEPVSAPPVAKTKRAKSKQ